MRAFRRHWGPVGRRELEIKDADPFDKHIRTAPCAQRASVARGRRAVPRARKCPQNGRFHRLATISGGGNKGTEGRRNPHTGTENATLFTTPFAARSPRGRGMSVLGNTVSAPETKSKRAQAADPRRCFCDYVLEWKHTGRLALFVAIDDQTTVFAQNVVKALADANDPVPGRVAFALGLAAGTSYADATVPVLNALDDSLIVDAGTGSRRRKRERQRRAIRRLLTDE
jgi:hypothetical protein